MQSKVTERFATENKLRMFNSQDGVHKKKGKKGKKEKTKKYLGNIKYKVRNIPAESHILLMENPPPTYFLFLFTFCFYGYSRLGKG